MGIFDTNAEHVAMERLRAARQQVRELTEYLMEVDRAMDEYEGGTFPLGWADGITQRASAIQSEISRCNGAVLVRAIEPKTT